MVGETMERPVHTRSLSVLEEPPRKILRLRISPNDEQSSDLSSLDVRNTAAIETLVRFEQRLESADVKDINEQLMTAFDKLKDTTNTMVRSKLIQLIHRITSRHLMDCSSLMKCLVSMINDSESHSLTAELLSLSSSIISLALNEALDYQTIIQAAKKGLNDQSSSVRSAALQLLCELIGISKKANLSLEDALGLQLIVIDYAHDCDPRVRCVALEMLAALNCKGVVLESNVYEEASKAVGDDYEMVRTAALRLLADLACLTPEKLVSVKAGAGQTIRMLDDGFTKICDCVNDLSYIVRVQAARLMGKFEGVSQQFLDQTLDKKLMSNMRRKVSAHERQREFYASGEWASGNRFADDAPKESVDESSISLVPIGACGAFVHTLEDEYMEVREAAVESMCTLAINNPSFASQSQDFLVDMFNDEIEDVRLYSIHSLRRMAPHLSLRDDQVEVITGALKDFSQDIRIGLHRMIQESRLATQSGLRDMVLGLLDNLRRYPEDRSTIWRAMKYLGTRHPGHVSPLLTEFLSLHPYFDMPEPQMDDECYVAVMILVYNAAAVEPSISSLFPDHAVKHYHYHRTSYPKLVPSLSQFERGKFWSPKLKSTDRASTLVSDVEKQLLTLDDLKSLAARRQMLSLCLRDLQHAGDKGNTDYAKGTFLFHYLKVLFLFTEVQEHLGNHDEKIVISLCHEVAMHCKKLLHLFNNVPSNVRSYIIQFNLISHSVALSQSINTNSAKPDHFKQYLQQLAKDKELLSGNDPLLAFTKDIVEGRESLEAGNWSVFYRAVNMLDLNNLPLPTDLYNINMITCELEQPQTRVDNPKSFTAGLAVCLPVRAELKNVNQNHKLCVRVLMPDMKDVIIPVKENSLSYEDDTTAEQMLTSQVVLSHGHWSEGSYAEVTICLMIDSTGEKVELCPPNRVYLTTKAEKKAHAASIV